MYADEDIKRGTPIRDFLLKLMLVIVFVLLLLWLLPTRMNNSFNKSSSSNNSDGTDTSVAANRVFVANIQEMKQAGIQYYTVDRLPKRVGSESKLTLRQMIDNKLLLEFTDKNGDKCDIDNSYVSVTNQENEFLMKTYLKCNDEEDYILINIGNYSYCSTKNSVCEKKETNNNKKTIVSNDSKSEESVNSLEKDNSSTISASGPKCVLEVESGQLGNNGWYIGSVRVGFKSKESVEGTKISEYGIGTSSSVNYNGNNFITINNDGTSKIYGYVKDSNGKSSVCSITVKKDSINPDCNISVLSGSKNTNGYYVGKVTVGFVKKIDNGSGLVSYGLSKTNNYDYNGKTELVISDIGSTKIYGYVKDKAGNTKICSTVVTIVNQDNDSTVSNPSCELVVTSGTKGNNNWYISNVVVGFRTKNSTNGARITAFGIGTSENYNNNTTYNISKDGTYTIKGYVKDSNGYISTCSINVKRDSTKPICSLSVISGTKNSSDEYTSNIVIGFKSKTDATSGIGSYGIDRVLSYGNNTSYNVTAEGSHTIYGYVKDNAGNTNICSIKVVKKTSAYEYQYYKTFGTEYDVWSSWITKEYDCNNPPEFKKTSTYESVDLDSGGENCIYKYRSRKVTSDTYTDYKWSHYNDSALLNAGYNYTGTKRLTN